MLVWSTGRKDKTAFQQLRHVASVKRIQHHAARLTEALQNEPLEKMIAQAKGRVIETERVRPLQERAARAARVEILALTGIAESISERASRAELFRTVLPIFGEALGFQGGEWSVSKATVRALGTIWGDEKIVSLLTYIAEHHKDIVVSRAAVAQLAKNGGDEAFRSLTRLLGSSDREIQRMAEETLELRQNYRCAVPALEGGLRSPAPEVRRRCAGVLERLNWIPKDPEGEGWRVVARRHWDKVLECGSPAIPALENALKGKNAQVREEAADTLDQLSWRPKQYAMRAWYLVARRAWDEAAALKITSTAALANALDDDDDSVSAAAIDCLSRVGAYAVPTLAGALHNSHDIRLQQRASKVIGAIVRGLPEEIDQRISELFIDAVPALMEAMADSHNRVLLEPAHTLADLAERVYAGPQVMGVFEDAIQRMREVSEGQHPILRKELDAARERILAAARCPHPETPSAFIDLGVRRGSRK